MRAILLLHPLKNQCLWAFVFDRRFIESNAQRMRILFPYSLASYLKLKSFSVVNLMQFFFENSTIFTQNFSTNFCIFSNIYYKHFCIFSSIRHSHFFMELAATRNAQVLIIILAYKRRLFSVFQCLARCICFYELPRHSVLCVCECVVGF